MDPQSTAFLSGAGSDWLRRFMANYAYPYTVGLVLLLLAGAAGMLVLTAPDSHRRVRRIVGLVIPVVVLVLVVPGASSRSVEVGAAIQQVPAWLTGTIGALLGVGVVELARILSRHDSEILPSTYALLLSILATTVLWALVFGSVESLRWALFFGVAGSGLNVVLRGVPVTRARLERDEECDEADLDTEDAHVPRLEGAAGSPDKPQCPLCSAFIRKTSARRVTCTKCGHEFKNLRP